MKGDYSRNPLSPFDLDPQSRSPYSRVLMQQGRVQLDADWNEQVAVLLHYLRTLAEDLIGPFGGPSDMKSEATGAEKKYGFEISVSDNQLNNMTIGRGRYYVDGILCENDPRGENGELTDTVKYFEQVQYPLGQTADPLPTTLPFLVYLDVWERHVSSLEAPNIHEVALGEADTTTRAEIVWQVRAWAPKPSSDMAIALADCPSASSTDPTVEEWLADKWDSLRKELEAENRGQLKAWTDAPGAESDAHPCLTAPGDRYRGAENQLYRVEIHRGTKLGDSGVKPTFKWSRENGSVAASWLRTEGDAVIVDQARGFAAGQWVELTDDWDELRGEPGQMVKLLKVEGEALTVDMTTVPKPVISRKDDKWHPRVRRWDHQDGGQAASANDDSDAEWSEGAIVVKEGQAILIEDGIRIQFEAGASYRTGDYWLIPARTASGDVQWPYDGASRTEQSSKFLPPHGVEHHYAPLAVIKAANDKVDLRREFAPVWRRVLTT